MVSDRLFPKLRQHFSDCGLRLGRAPDRSVVFPAEHPEVGDIEIYDDGDEVTAYLGRFTHVHFFNYDENLPEEQAAEKIADDVVAFLKRLFADEVVLLGSHKTGGGCCTRDREPQTPFSQNRGQEYVWSGPLATSG